MTFKITGMDKLTGGSIKGYSGTLTVNVPGIGGKKGFTYSVPINAAPSLDAAKARALKDLKIFAETLLSQVSMELSQVAP